MTTNRLREVDLERGMPTVRAALQQLSFELWRGRSLGCAAVKLIHGYGSSGKGGRIRVEARACLTLHPVSSGDFKGTAGCDPGGGVHHL